MNRPPRRPRERTPEAEQAFEEMSRRTAYKEGIMIGEMRREELIAEFTHEVAADYRRQGNSNLATHIDKLAVRIAKGDFIKREVVKDDDEAS